MARRHRAHRGLLMIGISLELVDVRFQARREARKCECEAHRDHSENDADKAIPDDVELGDGMRVL